jgi:hypothetical protein
VVQFHHHDSPKWRNLKRFLTMYRVNYSAKRFGLVGWEVFTSNDETVMNDCIKIACSQMSRMLEESVQATIIKI